MRPEYHRRVSVSQRKLCDGSKTCLLDEKSKLVATVLKFSHKTAMASSTLAFQMSIVRLLFASFFLKLIYRGVPFMKAHQNVPRNLRNMCKSSTESLRKVTPKINWGTKLIKIISSNTHEEFYLLGFNAVQSVVSQPTFRRNISPPSSESKNMPSKKSEFIVSWRLHVAPKRRMTYNRLHGVISQKVGLFITTDVRTWKYSYHFSALFHQHLSNVSKHMCEC
jgi:hypothetical protein